MKLAEHKLLADENLHSDVVAELRSRGFDVLSVYEEGLRGATDAELLQLAFRENRVVVTHDSDFGTLAILAGEPVVGILYLRPGHIDPRFTIETYNAVLQKDLDLTSPFIIVAHRKGSQVKVRLRELS